MSFIFHSGPGSVQTEQPNTSTFIDKGPFFDRFGDAKLPVLMSNDATIKAILMDIANRQWINLALPEVTAVVNHIATVVPELTQEIKDAVLDQFVKPEENLALRKLFFS